MYDKTRMINCIACGSKRVRRKAVSVRRKSMSVAVVVDADVCEVCGERYFDLEAMRIIEAKQRLRNA